MTSTENAATKDLQRLTLAIQARSQELELFWKRSLFFWGFIAAAFVGYAATLTKSPSVALFMACFGFVCSLAWALANRGSKYWQENWEQKVIAAEQSVVGTLFGSQEPRVPKGWFSAYRYSVSRLAIALSEFTVLIWIALLIREGFRAFGWTANDYNPRFLFAASVLGTASFCAIMMRGSYGDRAAGRALAGLGLINDRSQAAAAASITMRESPYLRDPSRLGDVIAAIQVTATYKFYKLDFAGWADRISADKERKEHWKQVFEEHPEFFRLDSAREKASLVWRRQYPRRFLVDELRTISDAELMALPQDIRSTRVSRTPLTAIDIKTLVDTAISLHSRALESKRETRWWIPLGASAVGGLVGAIVGTLLK